MFTAGNTIDIFGLLVLLCVVAGSNRWSWKTGQNVLNLPWKCRAGKIPFHSVLQAFRIKLFTTA